MTDQVGRPNTFLIAFVLLSVIEVIAGVVISAWTGPHWLGTMLVAAGLLQLLIVGYRAWLRRVPRRRAPVLALLVAGAILGLGGAAVLAVTGDTILGCLAVFVGVALLVAVAVVPRATPPARP